MRRGDEELFRGDVELLGDVVDDGGINIEGFFISLVGDTGSA